MSGPLHGCNTDQRDYTHREMTDEKPSLRQEHVRQTRDALVTAGRARFGAVGYSATSVDTIAEDAGLTTGALYHHFANKTELFVAVFEQIHLEILADYRAAAADSPTPIEAIARAFEAFLDAVLDPAVQRVIVIDAPAVLGLGRFTELDEKFAFAALTEALREAGRARQLRVRDAETLARLLLGTLARGSLLIATAKDPKRTRNDVASTVRDLLRSLAS